MVKGQTASLMITWEMLSASGLALQHSEFESAWSHECSFNGQRFNGYWSGELRPPPVVRNSQITPPG
jgi:hypothetical protein